MRNRTKRHLGLGPYHFRRQAHQYRVDIAAGLQSKGRAAIIYQVKFGIETTPAQLRLLFFGTEGLVHTTADKLRKYVEEAIADIAGEREILFKQGVACVFEMVVKYPANAAPLLYYETRHKVVYWQSVVD